MSIIGSIDDLMESKLLSLHTAYLAKVITTDGLSAKIQPLTKFKQYGKAAEKYAVIPDVPILNHTRWKVTEKEITFVTDVSVKTTGTQDFVTSVSLEKKTQKEQLAVLRPIEDGDIVFCVFAERDISDAKRGNVGTPAPGRHSLSNSVIVGVLQ